MSNNNGGSTFPIAGVLGIVFVVLKLTGYIGWSWLWVLAPFWVPLALVLVIALVTLPFVLVAKNKIEKGEFDFDSLFD